MCSNHHDLLEVAEIESLPLRHLKADLPHRPALLLEINFHSKNRRGGYSLPKPCTRARLYLEVSIFAAASGRLEPHTKTEFHRPWRIGTIVVRAVAFSRGVAEASRSSQGDAYGIQQLGMI